MISEEIRAGRHAFGQLGCHDFHSFEMMSQCFLQTSLSIIHSRDIVGISWSVILKNVYAMAFGIADELMLGDNVRGFLAVAALQELNQIVMELGGHSGTSLSSHHHELGRKLARGDTTEISGEGPHTIQMIRQHQLFDIQRYPLFRLIHSIMQHPGDVRKNVEGYFKQYSRFLAPHFSTHDE